MDGWGIGLAPVPDPDWLLSWKRHVWPYLPPHTHSFLFFPCQSSLCALSSLDSFNKVGHLHAEQVRNCQATLLDAAMLVGTEREGAGVQFCVKR